MPNSYVEITSNGSASQTLSFSFPYLNQTDIGVTVDGVTQTLTTHWSFATTQSIVFVSHPANGAVIRISRTTPSATRVVDFQDGSVLSEADLDNSADQIFFIAQEAADTAAQSIILDTDGKWEANSKPIKNVTNPTNAQDAVTKNYLENTWLSTSDKTQLNNLNTTNLNTVAGSVSNVNTVAGAITNVNTVAGKSTEIAALGTSSNVSNMDTLAASGVVGNIASVAGISSDVTTVAGKASLITSDFVSDLNTVAVTDVINDINTLATSDVVSDLNQLATSDFVSDLNQLATTTNVNNLGTVAGIAGNVTSVAGISSAVSTTAANVSAIQNASANASIATTQASNASTSATASATSATNAATSATNASTAKTAAETAKTAAETAQTAAAGSASSASTSLSSFEAQYRTGSSDPTSSLDTGDLFYNTTANQLKIYNGSAWENAAPAGSGFLATSGGTMTGNLALGDNVKATFGAGSDLEIYSDGNSSFIKENSGTGSLFIDANYVEIRKPDGSAVNAKFFDAGSAELYHNNAKMFETTSTGINVTGTVQADQFNNDEALPDIRPSLLLDFANSKTLDPRITFTRGSTATYYDGKTTAKAEENLLKYSQELDNAAWSVSGTTVTANDTTAPDGTTTAEKLAISTEGNYRNISQRPTGLPSKAYTLSVYLKKSNYDYISIDLQSRTSSMGFINSIGVRSINLTNGATIGSDTGTCTTTDVGNGWYRVTVSGTSASNAELIYIDVQFVDSSSNSAPSTNIANGSAVFVWGAQLEQRSSATAYTPTTSAPVVKYQPALQTAASGAARFDHAPLTGESKGLLIEEARTNIAYPSNQQSGVTLARVTQNTTGAIAPDGTQTASIVRETTETGAHHIHDSIVGETANTVYTASVYLKNYGVSDVALKMRISDSGDVYKQVFFDLDNIVVSFSGDAGYTGTITDVGNGWRRCTITGDVGDGTNDLRVHVFACQGTGTISSYTGNGWDGFGYWGLQVEVGSFPTSYIPTSGSAVTRAADSAIISGNSFNEVWNNTEMTIYHEASLLTIADFDTTVYSFDDNTSNYNEVYFTKGVYANGFIGYVRNNNASDASLQNSTALSSDDFHKAAFGLKVDDVALSVNDASLLTDTSVYRLPPATRLTLGGRNMQTPSDNKLYIKKLAIYPKRLSNATLQAMTEA